MRIPVSYVLTHLSQKLIHKYYNQRLRLNFIATEDLPPAKRRLLEGDAQRIALMRDSWGQAALQACVSNDDLLSGHAGPLDCALWVLLHEPESFAKAETLCARTPSRAGRLWHGFDFSGSSSKVNLSGKGQFSRRLYRLFSLPEVPRVDVITDDTETFLSARLDKLALLDLSYEPRQDRIHVVLDGPACHLEISKNFVACFLPEADGGSVQPCSYNFAPLFTKDALRVDPEDGLQDARLTRVDLTTADGNSMTVALRPDEPRGLPEVGRELFGDCNPIRCGLTPNGVEVSVSFYQEQTCTKRLPIRLHKTGASNIAGLCGEERSVAEKCLASWGVIAA